MEYVKKIVSEYNDIVENLTPSEVSLMEVKMQLRALEITLKKCFRDVSR